MQDRSGEFKNSQNTVSQAFQNFRQLLLHPPGVFDVHSAMAAFEHLSDNAPENGDQHARRYKAILKQTKGLFENQAIQRILLRLLGTKEEITIAKEIEKSTKSYRFLVVRSSIANFLWPELTHTSTVTLVAWNTARNCRARRGHNSQRYHNHVACTQVYGLN